MKTAQNVPRTGLALAKGEHLEAANESPPPSKTQRLMQNGWRYTPASETSVQATWRRFGWVPGLRRIA
jgi:hypothetical protein